MCLRKEIINWDKIKIRTYLNEPVDEILAIDNEAVEEFYELIKGTYSQKDLMNIKTYYTNGGFYVIYYQDELIGTCGYLQLDQQRVELKRLRIIKKYQGNGIGKRVLQFMEILLKNQGVKKIIFNTSSVRESTLRFYEKQGYSITGKSQLEALTLIDFEKKL